MKPAGTGNVPGRTHTHFMSTNQPVEQLLLSRPTCACSRCPCRVAVRSSVKICKACKNGAHDLRALRRSRGTKPRPQAA